MGPTRHAVVCVWKIPLPAAVVSHKEQDATRWAASPCAGQISFCEDKSLWGRFAGKANGCWGKHWAVINKQINS